ncbi:SAM-dependent methyltransferase [Serratia sp. BIGb0234]|uniref:class I SAM-dependent DNA methyltransferase n=1 Tax=Serratia sp. BIGb0234 TaxID=2940614 RepID=UPI00216938C1|nr:class I SAM-dependent methyltransferase [Serratia sp. BIGb0234]MCS4320833.1 SAM-dependent methyltransferase [Serratia sp. BIGb0234]
MRLTQTSDTSSINGNQTNSSKFDPATFDEYAGLYEEMLSWPYRKELELPTLKQLLGDLSVLNILDFGCGPGNISRWLNGLGGECISGYDISEGMLNYARRREEKERLGIDYFSEVNEKHEGSFDIVLAVYVMPYIAHSEDLLAMSQAMFKMLKPGGRLITLPMHPEFNLDPEYYRPIGLRLIEEQPRADGSQVRLHICQPPYDVNIQAYYWSRQTLESMLYQAGFQTVSWKSLNVPTKPLSLELSLYLQYPHAAIIECIKE